MSVSSVVSSLPQIDLIQISTDPLSLIEKIRTIIEFPERGYEFHRSLSGAVSTVLLYQNGEVLDRSRSVFSKIIDQVLAVPEPAAAVQEKIYPLLNQTEFGIQKVEKIKTKGEFQFALGRSLVYKDDRGVYHVYKFLKSGEQSRELAGECAAMKAWQQIPDAYWYIPVARGVYHYQRFHNLPCSGHEAFKAKDSICFYYTCDHEGLFHYPHEFDYGSESDYQASRENFIKIQTFLIKNGLVHTTADLFHNQGTNRKYIPVPENNEAGRLDKWQEAVRYPNFRLQGVPICDLFDMNTFDQIVKDPSILSSDVKNVRDKEIFNISLSRVLFVDMLVLMNRRQKEGRVSFDNAKFIEELSEDLKKGFSWVLSSFADIDYAMVKKFTDDCGFDWSMAARQLSFWTTPYGSSGYISHLTNNGVPSGLYDADTRVFFSLNCPNWRPCVGYSKDKVNHDLGAFNGPFPATAFAQVMRMCSAYAMVLRSKGTLEDHQKLKAALIRSYNLILPDNLDFEHCQTILMSLRAAKQLELMEKLVNRINDYQMIVIDYLHDCWPLFRENTKKTIPRFVDIFYFYEPKLESVAQQELFDLFISSDLINLFDYVSVVMSEDTEKKSALLRSIIPHQALKLADAYHSGSNYFFFYYHKKLGMHVDRIEAHYAAHPSTKVKIPFGAPFQKDDSFDPIEYKRDASGANKCDPLQLLSDAMCTSIESVEHIEETVNLYRLWHSEKPIVHFLSEFRKTRKFAAAEAVIEVFCETFDELPVHILQSQNNYMLSTLAGPCLSFLMKKRPGFIDFSRLFWLTEHLKDSDQCHEIGLSWSSINNFLEGKNYSLQTIAEIVNDCNINAQYLKFAAALWPDIPIGTLAGILGKAKECARFISTAENLTHLGPQEILELQISCGENFRYLTMVSNQRPSDSLREVAQCLNGIKDGFDLYTLAKILKSKNLSLEDLQSIALLCNGQSNSLGLALKLWPDSSVDQIKMIARHVSPVMLELTKIFQRKGFDFEQIMHIHQVLGNSKPHFLATLNYWPSATFDEICEIAGYQAKHSGNFTTLAAAFSRRLTPRQISELCESGCTSLTEAEKLWPNLSFEELKELGSYLLTAHHHFMSFAFSYAAKLNWRQIGQLCGPGKPDLSCLKSVLDCWPDASYEKMLMIALELKLAASPDIFLNTAELLCELNPDPKDICEYTKLNIHSRSNIKHTLEVCPLLNAKEVLTIAANARRSMKNYFKKFNTPFSLEESRCIVYLHPSIKATKVLFGLYNNKNSLLNLLKSLNAIQLSNLIVTCKYVDIHSYRSFRRHILPAILKSTTPFTLNDLKRVVDV